MCVQSWHTCFQRNVFFIPPLSIIDNFWYGVPRLFFGGFSGSIQAVFIAGLWRCGYVNDRI